MHIVIEKPQLSVAASLIIDDPTPCINPFYYYRLHVEREGWNRHEQFIPVDFLEQFAAVCAKHGVRGKFSVLPYPAGLGSIALGWEGAHDEIAAWLDLARTHIAPRFDITPEVLTHTRALDLATGELLPQSEQDWMSEQPVDVLTDYMSASLRILREVGFAPNGITQPVEFNGSFQDYAQATRDAVLANGGPPVTYFFISGEYGPPPLPDHEVLLLERERGEAVVSILSNCNDHFWPTQHGGNQRAEDVVDGLITADGRGGRLVELAEANEWVVPVCHWQTLFSDGSREGLKALDRAFTRFTDTYGPRLRWLTISEIALYRAASEACIVDAQPADDGWRIALDSAFDCSNWTISVPVAHVGQVAYWGEDGDTHLLARALEGEALLPPNTWRQHGERLVVCFNLRRGIQYLLVRHEANP